MDFAQLALCERIDKSTFAALINPEEKSKSVSEVSESKSSAPALDEEGREIVVDEAPTRRATKSAGARVAGGHALKHAAVPEGFLSHGKVTDHYTMGGVLGKGSFGEVHKARRVVDGKRWVALVVLFGHDCRVPVYLSDPAFLL